ncbi:hypothetical protein [Aureibacter tunicatorum]|uniref:Lipoprotein n=1 Tax=Aureibacter tunicatorum TaxID=866807 RepID=A0AAE3XPZ6_9BACT|nr:hypothetical protein [Aureibacter tunicatorum]MDR6240485.1 hypothetical protein [Aureibacter tunicatorum]BDD06652.1 hypothetical protein AUTU_41350 [Aureibacter tunicatorum]
MNKSLLYFFIIICVVFASCKGAKGVQSRLNKLTPNRLYYIHDTERKPDKSDVHIDFLITDNSRMKTLTTVKRNKGPRLYFLIGSYIDYSMSIKSGNNLFAPTLKEFYTKSLQKQAERTALAQYHDKSEQYSSEYDLSLTIKKCDISSRYNYHHSHFLFYMNYDYGINRSVNKTVVEAVLKNKEGEEVFKKNYSMRHSPKYPSNIIESPKSLEFDFMVNVSENVSETTKKIIDQLVIDIDMALELIEVEKAS